MKKIEEFCSADTDIRVVNTNKEHGVYMILINGVAFPIHEKIFYASGEEGIVHFINYCGEELEVDPMRYPREKVQYLPDGTIMRREFEEGDRAPIMIGQYVYTCEVTIPKAERAGKGLVDLEYFVPVDQEGRYYSRIAAMMNRPIVYLPLYNRKGEIYKLQAAVQLSERRNSTDTREWPTGYFTVGGI